MNRKLFSRSTKSAATFLAAAFLAAAFLAAAFPLGVLYSDKSEPGTPKRGPAAKPEHIELSRAQCRKLYAHQLKIALTDPDNPLAPALRLNREALASAAAREAQRERCRKRVSLANYRCQLLAESLMDIMQCRRKYPAAGTGGNGKSKIRTDHITDKKNIIGARFSAGDCKKTYDHLLTVYGDSKEFQKRKDSEALLRRWASGAARESFQRRCLKAFQARDLNCILSTRDPEVIQACLLRVPR